jgi:hypothetical protein
MRRHTVAQQRLCLCPSEAHLRPRLLRYRCGFDTIKAALSNECR